MATYSNVDTFIMDTDMDDAIPVKTEKRKVLRIPGKSILVIRSIFKYGKN